MRTINALLVALLAACGGSQDTGSEQTQLTGEPPVDDTPTDQTPTEETPADEPVKPVEVKPAPPRKLTIEEKVAVQTTCFTDWIKEDASYVDRCYTADATMQHMDGQPANVGRAAIGADSKEMWAGFTMDGEIQTVLGGGDSTLLIVGLLTGTNDGDFMGSKATGKTFGLHFVEVQELDDQGRTKASRLYFDPGTMVAQLGLAKFPARKAVTKTGAETVWVGQSGSDAETSNTDLVKGGFELFAKHDYKNLVALYAADAVLAELPAPVDAKGKKAIQAMLTELGKAFPDGKAEITAAWGAGDYVVVEATFTGTNTGTSKMLGIKKASKKAMTLHEAHVFKIEGGKVKQHWIAANGMAMATQIDLIPLPAAPKNP